MHPQRTTPSIRFTTRHAFLALTGLVAEALGLRKTLESGLRIKQKVYQHAPVDTVRSAGAISS